MLVCLLEFEMVLLAYRQVVPLHESMFVILKIREDKNNGEGSGAEEKSRKEYEGYRRLACFDCSLDKKWTL